MGGSEPRDLYRACWRVGEIGDVGDVGGVEWG